MEIGGKWGAIMDRSRRGVMKRRDIAPKKSQEKNQDSPSDPDLSTEPCVENLVLTEKSAASQGRRPWHGRLRHHRLQEPLRQRRRKSRADYC